MATAKLSAFRRASRTNSAGLWGLLRPQSHNGWKMRVTSPQSYGHSACTQYATMAKNTRAFHYVHLHDIKSASSAVLNGGRSTALCFSGHTAIKVMTRWAYG